MLYTANVGVDLSGMKHSGDARLVSHLAQSRLVRIISTCNAPAESHPPATHCRAAIFFSNFAFVTLSAIIKLQSVMRGPVLMAEWSNCNALPLTACCLSTLPKF